MRISPAVVVSLAYGFCGRDVCAQTAATRTVEVTLASRLSRPRHVVVDGGFVYWATLDAIERRSVGSGPITTVVRGPRVWSFSVDATDAYWTTLGELQTAPLSGGASKTLAVSAVTGVLAGSIVYYGFVNTAQNQNVGMPMQELRARQNTGGAFSTIASEPIHNVGQFPLAVDATYVYWTSRTGVRRRARTGGAITDVGGVLTVAGRFTDMHVNATHVYLCATTDTDLVIVRAPLAGGPWEVHVHQSNRRDDTLSPVGMPFHDMVHFAIDATSIYWANPMLHGVYKTELTRGRARGPIILMSYGNTPTDVAVDATSLYYTDFDAGRVARITPK